LEIAVLPYALEELTGGVGRLPNLCIYIKKILPAVQKYLQDTSGAYGVKGCFLKTVFSSEGIVLCGGYKKLNRYFSVLRQNKTGPVGIAQAAGQMQQALSGYGKKTFMFTCRDYKLKLSQRTRIMGVLNVTPDSFSDGGNYFDADKAVVHALEMEKDGADIIDIGAESTRPGAAAVPAAEQLRRIEGIVRILAKKLKVPISIDTSDSLVARRCLDAGASIINDVYALRKDEKLGTVVARYKAGLVLMHMQNSPRIMQRNPRYNDVIAQITDFLKKAKEKALACGIREESIIVDPGIGFGKTTEHNLKIIKYLSRFKVLGSPLLIGTSRKSFIGNVLGVTVGEREFGTAASVALCASNGAHIVRVHEVRHMREVITITEAINKQKACDD